MKTFKWVVEIEVDETWVADGYEATADRVKEAILGHSLGFAYENEIKVRQISKPSDKSIRIAQGESK